MFEYVPSTDEKHCHRHANQPSQKNQRWGEVKPLFPEDPEQDGSNNEGTEIG